MRSAVSILGIRLGIILMGSYFALIIIHLRNPNRLNYSQIVDDGGASLPHIINKPLKFDKTMAENNSPCKAYVCFNRHEGKIYGCWVDEYFADGGCTETNFDGDVHSCMEYWIGLRDKARYGCFVKVFDV